MTTHHTIVDFYAGDDWEIRATLLDENGVPYDLSTLPVSAIEWALTNYNKQRVLNGTDVSISVIDGAAGQCSILIPSEKTAGLPSGLYSDVLRITTGGVTSTLAVGSVHIVSNAFEDE